MIPDVVRAVHKGGYLIEVHFEDGSSGTVDFSGYPSRGGVFSRFSDLEYFRSFEINPELGVLSWCGEADIAPETLFALATGASPAPWSESIVSKAG
jgi:hypothetical protein